MSNNYIKVILEALNLANIKIDDISYFLINQNSINIVNKVIEKLKIPSTKLHTIRESHGHMGAVDTLFALEQCIKKKVVKENDIILLASTGIGYHWGAQIIKI